MKGFSCMFQGISFILAAVSSVSTLISSSFHPVSQSMCFHFCPLNILSLSVQGVSCGVDAAKGKTTIGDANSNGKRIVVI